MIRAVEKGDYDLAYNRYKSSILALNEQFGTKKIEKETGFVKKLGYLSNKLSLV